MVKRIGIAALIRGIKIQVHRAVHHQTPTAGIHVIVQRRVAGRTVAGGAVIVVRHPLPAVNEHEAPHHRQVVQAQPDDAAVGGPGGNLLAPEVRLLGVAQCPQVEGARLMRVELEIGQVVGDALRGNLEADVRRLVALVGQEQNRFAVFIQMPGVRPRARPAVPFILTPAVHPQMAPATTRALLAAGRYRSR